MLGILAPTPWISSLLWLIFTSPVLETAKATAKQNKQWSENHWTVTGLPAFWLPVICSHRAARENIFKAQVRACQCPAWDWPLAPLWFDENSFLHRRALTWGQGSLSSERDKFISVGFLYLSLNQALPSVMVNFMCQIDWAIGVQMFGEMLFLGVSGWD